MKFKLLTAALVLLATSASFAGIRCKSGDDLPYVVLEISENVYYSVAVVGFRVNYQARYKINSSSGNIVKETLVLEKTLDSSTWKNMPAHLILVSTVTKAPPNAYQLTGLNMLSQGRVGFTPQNCEYIQN